MYKGLLTEIKDIDEKGVVTVAANAIGNVDSQKDISLPNSFNKTINENFPRLKWFLNHNSDFLLGVPLEAKENEAQLQIRGQLNMKKELSRDVYEDYKLYAANNKSLEHSIGVDAIKHKMVGDIRHVSEWKLWEFSTLYGWGANEKTPLLNIKSTEDLMESLNWLELKMKKGNYTDQKFIEIQKTINHLRSLSLEPGNSTQTVQPKKLQFSLLN